jgi:hypothetical protein
MFKIESLFEEIGKIVQDKKSEADKKSEIIDTLISILFEINPSVIEKFSDQDMPYMYAIPCSKITSGINIKPLSKEYSIIAADGSIIPINDDFYFPYFVINTGFAYIRYGKKHEFFADSNPQIFYKEEDIYENFQGGGRQLIKGESLSARMLLKESLEIENLLQKFSQRDISTLALIDGTLIQWEIKEKTDEFKKDFIGKFEHLFQTAEKLNIPMAGYISGTRSRDALGTIKIYMDITSIEYNDQFVSLIFDRDIFARILKQGERSILFKSTEPILKFYQEPIYFFFLNTGEEVVRIEIPEFVAKDSNKLDSLHFIIMNQIIKGPNYPVVLREAHEQAVIHSIEKSTLEDIFTELLSRNKLEYKENSKLSSKRSRQF